MNLCVIPARGGSKRIPRKNIRQFAGRPMLAYAIDAAHLCGLFSAILVSSEDPEILQLAEHLNATPLTRPVELADDHTPTVPVISHAIAAYRNLGHDPKAVCCIYPGVPFLQPSDLIASF